MKIVVSGGTGFLGRPLCQTLTAEGHEVVVLSRSTARASGGGTIMPWTPDGTAGPWVSALEGAGAVINLAGESLAARRWSAAQKQRLRDSRLLSTRSLVEGILGASAPPAVFITGSAVGYYGYDRDGPLTEADGPGRDFLATLCADWEGEAERAATRTRVVRMRSGVVLERDGGVLQKMLLPFRLFVGGPIGSGDQYLSWIHRTDWIALVRWILTLDGLSGPLNATAPEPVTNAAFSTALGRAIRRPSWLPVPGVVLRVALGELAEVALLNGQAVVPARATGAGFSFRYPVLDRALRAVFESRRSN